MSCSGCQCLVDCGGLCQYLSHMARLSGKETLCGENIVDECMCGSPLVYGQGDVKKTGACGHNLKDKGARGQNIKEKGVFGQTIKEKGLFGQPIKEKGFFGQPNKESGLSGQPIKEKGVFGQAIKESGLSGQTIKEKGVFGQTFKEKRVSGQTIKEKGVSGQRAIDEKKRMISEAEKLKEDMIMHNLNAMSDAGCAGCRLCQDMLDGEVMEKGVFGKPIEESGLSGQKTKEKGVSGQKTEEKGVFGQVTKEKGKGMFKDIKTTGVSSQNIKKSGLSGQNIEEKCGIWKIQRKFVTFPTHPKKCKTVFSNKAIEEKKRMISKAEKLKEEMIMHNLNAEITRIYGGDGCAGCRMCKDMPDGEEVAWKCSMLQDMIYAGEMGSKEDDTDNYSSSESLPELI